MKFIKKLSILSLLLMAIITTAFEIKVVNQATIFGGKADVVQPNGQLSYIKGANVAKFARKSYLGFELKTNGESIGSAQLEISIFTKIKRNKTCKILLYGLKDGIATDEKNGWDSKTITWNNAPANDKKSGTDVNLGQAVLLDSVAIAPNANKLIFKNPNIANFLNQDTNGNVTFILVNDGNPAEMVALQSHKGKYNIMLRVNAGENPKAQAVETATVANNNGNVAPVKAKIIWDNVDAYRENLKKSLKAETGSFLVTDREENITKVAKPKNGAVNAKIIDAEGMDFSKIIQLRTQKKGKGWDAGLEGKIPGQVNKGDIVYLTLAARSVESALESGDALFYLIVKGKKGLFRKNFSVGKKWQQLHLAVKAEANFAPNELQLCIWTGENEQILEIGGLAIMNLGPNYDIDSLPKTQLDLNYDGQAKDASWRKEAAERIEKYRKADLNLTLVDENNQPIKNKNVNVEMKKHKFYFGLAFNVKRWFDKNKSIQTRYRNAFDKLLKENAFNSIVFENALKPLLIKGQANYVTVPQIQEAMQWAKDNKIRLRGHTMNWGVRYLTKQQMSLLKNKENDKLQKTLLDTIDHTSNFTKGYVDCFDVVNEHFYYPELTDLLGQNAAVAWYKEAKKILGDDVDLFWNENCILSESPQAPLKRVHTYEWVKALKEQGAPIDGIGLQSHIGLSATSMYKIKDLLDMYAKLGVKLESTEFDIGITEANDKTQSTYKKNFTNDFMTMLFSHPSVIGINYWSAFKGWTYVPNGELFDQTGKVLNGGDVWMDLVTKQWWTSEKAKTNNNGNINVRGFKGEYEINVAGYKPVYVSLDENVNKTIKLLRK